MSRFNLRQFVCEQYCVPWKLRLMVQAVIPWQARRFLAHGYTNPNTAKIMNARYAARGDDQIYCQDLYRHILPMLPRRGRLLDAGCGLGVLLRLIRKELPELELHGADISSVAAERICRQGFLGQCAVLPELPYETAFFDCVVSTEVLEHLDEPLETVRTFYRILKPGGHLIVSVPHGMGPDHCIEHVQDFNEDLLRECLTKGGFSVNKVDLVEREPSYKPGASFVVLATRQKTVSGKEI